MVILLWETRLTSVLLMIVICCTALPFISAPDLTTDCKHRPPVVRLCIPVSCKSCFLQILDRSRP